MSSRDSPVKPSTATKKASIRPSKKPAKRVVCQYTRSYKHRHLTIKPERMHSAKEHIRLFTRDKNLRLLVAKALSGSKKLHDAARRNAAASPEAEASKVACQYRLRKTDPL